MRGPSSLLLCRRWWYRSRRTQCRSGWQSPHRLCAPPLPHNLLSGSDLPNWLRLKSLSLRRAPNSGCPAPSRPFVFARRCAHCLKSRLFRRRQIEHIDYATRPPRSAFGCSLAASRWRCAELLPVGCLAQIYRREWPFPPHRLAPHWRSDSVPPRRSRTNSPNPKPTSARNKAALKTASMRCYFGTSMRCYFEGSMRCYFDLPPPFDCFHPPLCLVLLLIRTRLPVDLTRGWKWLCSDVCSLFFSFILFLSLFLLFQMEP